MTRYNIFGALLIAAALVAAPAAGAQALKIGVVNFGRLLEESPQAKAAQQALENEFAARKRELQNMERDLKAREERLQKDGATMAELILFKIMLLPLEAAKSIAA